MDGSDQAAEIVRRLRVEARNKNVDALEADGHRLLKILRDLNKTDPEIQLGPLESMDDLAGVLTFIIRDSLDDFDDLVPSTAVLMSRVRGDTDIVAMGTQHQRAVAFSQLGFRHAYFMRNLRELMNSCVDAFERTDHLVAALLLRGSLEQFAFHLPHVVELAELKSRGITGDDLESELHRIGQAAVPAMFASKGRFAVPNMPARVNILTLVAKTSVRLRRVCDALEIDRLDILIPDVFYDWLSSFIHPGGLSAMLLVNDVREDASPLKSFRLDPDDHSYDRDLIALTLLTEAWTHLRLFVDAAKHFDQLFRYFVAEVEADQLDLPGWPTEWTRVDPYAPCICGSGKKTRFCHRVT